MAKTLSVVISGDSSQLSRAFAKAGRDTATFEGRVDKSSKNIGRHLGTMAKVGSAALAGGLVLGLKESVSAFMEAEKISAQTAATLKSTGGVAKVTAKDIGALADSISRKTGIDDEAIQSGENLLLTFTKIRNETGKGNAIFDRATQTVADFSVTFKKDLAGSAILVGKALNDPIKGLSSLARVGVQFDEGQKKQITTLVKSGKTLEAQKVILKELEVQTKGAAEAYGNTLPGKIDKAKNALGNLGEVIGGAVAPFIGKAAEKLSKFTTEMQKGTGQGGRFVRTLRDIWEEAKPIIQTLGNAAKRVAEFASKHPSVAKLAAAVVGVGLALKTLRFLSAATGFSSLLKAGGVAARGLKRVLARGGVAAGEAAAANAAESMASQMPKSLGARQGKIGAAMKTSGRVAGKAFGAALIIGAVVGLTGLGAAIIKKTKEELGVKSGFLDMLAPDNLLPKVKPGGLLYKLGLGRAAGGMIPGTGSQDTVPIMATPGEYVIRKAVVEKFGPTYFAALNSGQMPQRFAVGGRVSGLRPEFMNSLRALSADSGKDINVTSGLRSFAEQTALWNRSDKSGRMVARPGTSKHESGIAADIAPQRGAFSGAQVAGNGLFFPMSWEPWHIQYSGGGTSAARTVGSAPSSAPRAKPDMTARRERAGSRLFNKVAGPFTGAVSRATRGAARLGTEIEDSGSAYGRLERLQGQSDEDLGTAGGRAGRLSELAALKKEKGLQLARQKKRAAALKTAIAKLDAQLAAMTKKLGEKRKGRHVLRGVKRAKFFQRMRAPQDRRVDLRAELKALGGEIADTALDIGDLNKEAGDVAATPDTAVDTPDAPDAPDPGPSATDKVSSALSRIDALERAGDLSSTDAQAARVGILKSAIAGDYGALTDDETLGLRGDLKEATSALTQATVDNTSALKDLKDSIDAQLAYANGVSAVTSMQAVRAMGDIISGQLGTRVTARATMPGSGALSRL